MNNFINDSNFSEILHLIYNFYLNFNEILNIFVYYIYGKNNNLS